MIECLEQRGALLSVLFSLPEGREIGISLPNNQRQHRTVHIQKNVLPYLSC